MPMKQVLVVDDEDRMRELLRLYLQTEYTVIEAADGQEAMERLHTESPALVLLDVMMPKVDGWATLQQIRAESAVPVVMLTARSDTPDRVQGLNMGADDYISKPFDGRELLARLQAVLRRSHRTGYSVAPITAGDLVVQPNSRTALWRGQELPLTPKEFDLLLLLVAHSGQVFPRERLRDRVWGAEYEGGVRAVDCHIKNLREKLGDGGRLIATVWGVGYRFAEVKNGTR